MITLSNHLWSMPCTRFFFFFSTSGCRNQRHFYKQASSTNIFLTKKMDFRRTNSQTCNIYKQWKTSTTHTHGASVMRAQGANVDTHFHDTFRTSPIQPSSTSLWIRFIYYILFILLNMAQAHATYGRN